MKRMFTLVMTLLLLSLVLILPVSADMGPKPSITVTVVNPPDETYYLDLLVQQDPGDTVSCNLTDEELASLPTLVRAALEGYSDGGWRPALTVGTRIPLFGSLTGEVQEDGTTVHTFSYHGTPSEYRIILVTSDGTVTTTDPLVRETFRQTVTYDFAAGEVTNETSIIAAYATQFAMTCTCTLLLEGVLLWAFGLMRRENLLPFFAMNLVTQIGLTAVTGSTLIFSGEIAAYGSFVLCELVILAAEAVACALFLHGHSRLRRVIYALAANLLSAGMGWLLIGVEFLLIY